MPVAQRVESIVRLSPATNVVGRRLRYGSAPQVVGEAEVILDPSSHLLTTVSDTLRRQYVHPPEARYVVDWGRPSGGFTGGDRMGGPGHIYQCDK